MTDDTDKDLLRAETIAERLDISKRTFQTWVSKGKFPNADLRCGTKLVFWRRETYDAWLANPSFGKV